MAVQMPDTLDDLAARLGPLLLARGWTVATAESCTGGLMGHAVTEIAGSSDYFIGGVISYANEVKERLLGVPREALRMHGAVSSQVALAMAQGARRLLGADAAVAATGVAGPSGGTASKPVGTVFVAVSSPLGDTWEQHLWTQDRRGNKRLSAEAGLRLLLRQLTSSE
jgi:PncC family amidohydrolase